MFYNVKIIVLSLNISGFSWTNIQKTLSLISSNLPWSSSYTKTTSRSTTSASRRRNRTCTSLRYGIKSETLSHTNWRREIPASGTRGSRRSRRYYGNKPCRRKVSSVLRLSIELRWNDERKINNKVINIIRW